jgi:hypothetical protein
MAGDDGGDTLALGLGVRWRLGVEVDDDDGRDGDTSGTKDVVSVASGCLSRRTRARITMWPIGRTRRDETRRDEQQVLFKTQVESLRPPPSLGNTLTPAQTARSGHTGVRGAVWWRRACHTKRRQIAAWGGHVVVARVSRGYFVAVEPPSTSTLCSVPCSLSALWPDKLMLVVVWAGM